MKFSKAEVKSYLERMRLQYGMEGLQQAQAQAETDLMTAPGDPRSLYIIAQAGKMAAKFLKAQARREAWEEKHKARQEKAWAKEKARREARILRLAEENPYFVVAGQERQVSMEVRQDGHGRHVIGRYRGPASLCFDSALLWAKYYARAHNVGTVAVDTAEEGNFRAEFSPSGRVK